MPPPPTIRMAAELKAESMKRYGKPAEEVEDEYLKMLSSNDPTDEDSGDSGIGRRKKP